MRFIKHSILIFLLAQIVYSQNADLQFEHFTTADGLVTNWMVRCPIEQDAQGFLWFGSDHGLHKYDGYKFTVYTHIENDSTSISNSSIKVIHRDRKGSLWIGTGSGLNKWQPETESFKHYSFKDSGITSINQIFEDNEGNLWLVGNRVVKFNPDRETIKFYKDDFRKINDRLNNNISAGYLDKNDIYWLSGENILIKYNPATSEIKQYDLREAKFNNNSNILIECIREDLSGRLLIGGKNCLYYLDRDNESIECLRNLKNNSLKIFAPEASRDETVYYAGDVQFIFQSPTTREYWIGSNNAGVNRFDDSGKLIMHYNKGLETSIFEDKTGVLWFGTISNGLYKAISSISNFEPQGYGLDALNILTGQHILGVLEDNFGNLWLGTTNSILYKYNFNSKKIVEYSHKTGNAKGLGNGSINFVFIDSKHRIWVGTFRGLSLYNPKSDSFSTYYVDPDNKNSEFNYFVYAAEESSGNLTIGIWKSPENYTRNYLFNLNEKTGKGTFIYIPDYPQKLVLKNNGGKVKEITAKTVGQYLPNLSSHSVLEDKNGMVWIGASEGLFKFNPVNHQYKWLTTKDGLPVNTMGGILEDDEGYLWIANSAGLLKLNPDDGNFIQFGKDDGLTNNLFEEQKAAFKSKTGLMYFGGFNGLTVIDPKRLKSNTVKPEVQITGFEIFGKSVPITKNGILNKSVSLTEQIKLVYNQNDITVDYVGLHYKNPNKNKYAYKLEPYEKEWNYVEDIRKAHYTNLSAGKYTFFVKASNSDGIWNEEGKQLSIIVNPPPWATWWAYSLYVLFAFGVLYSVRKFELNRRNEKENKRLLQLENERKTKELEQAKEIEKAYTKLKATQAQLIHSEKMASLGELTAGIAHEIKNPLNFINNFSEISRELLNEMKTELQNKNEKEVAGLIKDLNQNLEKINHHGKRADSIVKGMLLHSRATTGEKTLTNINELLEQDVNLAYHGMRATNREFNITIEKDYDETLEKINVVPQDISRVFLNIINNACYAAYDRKRESSDNNFSPVLRVSTKQLNGKAEIRIGDNGNGIPKVILNKIFQPFFTTKPTGEGTGLGLSLSYDIVTKVHGGELKVETEEGEGTEFIIKLLFNN
jgi:signal transduction histidine kinase/ligand-binding sensor domain-containing protein